MKKSLSREDLINREEVHVKINGQLERGWVMGGTEQAKVFVIATQTIHHVAWSKIIVK